MEDGFKPAGQWMNLTCSLDASLTYAPLTCYSGRVPFVASSNTKHNFNDIEDEGKGKW